MVLNATISNRTYEVTAEMLESAQANVIGRDILLQFLCEHGKVALHVVEELSRNYYTAHEEIRTLGLTIPTAGRLAKLLLSWSPEPGSPARPSAPKLPNDPYPRRSR